MFKAVTITGIALVLTGCFTTSHEVDNQPAVSRLLPALVSTAAIEDGATYSADRKVLIFSRRSGQWGAGGSPGTLYVIQKTGEYWSSPERLPFSGAHDDGDPFLTPDGQYLFFISNRPAAGKQGDDHDIWRVAKTVTGWGQPQHLGPPLSSAGHEYSPVVTANGTLYFASTRRGGFGQGDLYVAQHSVTGYSVPKNLGPVLNSPSGEWNVFVTADNELLIFEASGRATNRSPAGDLYVSHRQRGKWTAPLSLRSINTKESELNARISPDGAVLLFSRSVREPDGHWHTDLFTVPAADVLPVYEETDNEYGEN